MIGRWFNGLNPGDNTNHLQKVLDVLESSDVLVLGAGNVITEDAIGLFRGPLLQACVLSQMAALVQVPVVLYGLSATPIRSYYGKSMASWLLREADAVTFRDNISLSILEASGVDVPSHVVHPDPVLGARKSSKLPDEFCAAAEIPSSPGLRLALAPRWLPDGSTDNVHTHAQLAKRWLREFPDSDVLFVPQCTYDDEERNNDRSIIQEIISQEDFAGRAHYPTSELHPWDLELLYGTADLAVCTRLHGSVFAARQGTPIVGLEYNPKVRGFFETLGMGDFVLPVESTADEIWELSQTVLNSRDAISHRLFEAVARSQQHVSRYAEIIVQTAL